MPALGLSQSLAFAIGGGGCGGLHVQSVDRHSQSRPGGENNGALHQILQLANISRPVVSDQNAHGLAGDGVHHLAHAAGELLHEVAHQQRYIVLPVAQGRDLHGEYVQAIEQVGAELAVFHHPGEIAIGGGDEAGVGSHGSRASQPFEFPLLQDAQ